MIAISSDEATLVAAGVAALASLAVMVMNIRGMRSSEMRVAQREALETHVEELGKAIYEIVATAHVVVSRARKGQSLESWYSRSSEASDTVKDLRLKIRYPLWGIDEGLRAITRLPDWTQHTLADHDKAEELVRRADRLRSALDITIRNCYIDGRTPNLIERCRVRWSASQLHDFFDSRSDENAAGDAGS